MISIFLMALRWCGQLLMYSSYHRFAAGSDRYIRRLARSYRGNVRFCASGAPIHPLFGPSMSIPVSFLPFCLNVSLIVIFGLLGLYLIGKLKLELMLSGATSTSPYTCSLHHVGSLFFGILGLHDYRSLGHSLPRLCAHLLHLLIHGTSTSAPRP